MAFALESFFSEDKFKELTFVFESQTIVSLSSLYVEMIHKQISANFLKLLVDIERISITNHVAMERIATISVLESLLTTTLFTGFTYSFAGSLVWNRSTVEFQSMELMKYIRVLDRPVFELEFFGNNIFKLSATNEILNTIFSKLFKTRSFNFPPVNLVIQFNEVNVSDQQKARLLWEIYFKELNPNAFLASSRDPRWKLVSLNREKIGVLRNAFSFRGIVAAIFNFKNFSTQGSWKNKYHMKLAVQWLESLDRGVSKAKLELQLNQAVRDMGIERIHYVGDEDFNACSNVHVPVKLDDRTDLERDADIILQSSRLLSFNEVDSYEASSRRDVLLRNEVRGEGNRWGLEELNNLFKGIVKYGVGKWKQIALDRSFQFNNRDNKSLRGKFNTLKEHGIIIHDQLTGHCSISERHASSYPRFAYEPNRLRDYEHNPIQSALSSLQEASITVQSNPNRDEIVNLENIEISRPNTVSLQIPQLTEFNVPVFNFGQNDDDLYRDDYFNWTATDEREAFYKMLNPDQYESNLALKFLIHFIF